MLTRRRLLTSSLALPLALVACSDDEDADGDVTVTQLATVTVTRTPTHTAATTPSPTSTNDLDLEDLTGFMLPIAGACLPAIDNLMPNAPRTYRQGVHEGLDFYPGLACAPIAKGTLVLAMLGGEVVRADFGYEELTPDVLAELRAETARLDMTPPEILDTSRGRQVWVDHGQGVMTRYCHLSSILPGIETGARVGQGQALAGVGESGTPESIEAPGAEIHLHAEVRIGDGFLGQNLDPASVRALYARLFGQT
jgi:murein DD-endopeptidase MepM/ murein hydrolase activator NlpD